MKTQTYALEPGSTLQVDTISSDVTVNGWSELQVQVEMPDDEEIRIERSPNKLRINGLTLGEAVIRVRVPQNVQLRVNTVSGDITCAQAGGDLIFATTSGDINADGASGRVSAHSVSGDLRLSGSEYSGLSVETVSGDVALTGALSEQGEFNLRSISGDMKLELPADQGCTVLFHTLSGDFTCAPQHQVRRQGWGKIEAVVNDGGVTLRCSSTSGSLTIKAGEASGARPANTTEEQPASRPTKPLKEPFVLNETPVPEPQPPTYRTRMDVLKAIDEGKLSVSEGLALLQKLG